MKVEGSCRSEARIVHVRMQRGGGLRKARGPEGTGLAMWSAPYQPFKHDIFFDRYDPEAMEAIGPTLGPTCQVISKFCRLPTKTCTCKSGGGSGGVS